MTDFRYPATLKPEPEGGYTVRFLDFPEAITHGNHRPDARVQAADCLEEAVANRIAAGLAIPAPSQRRRSTPIPLAPAMAAKAALYLAVREAGISNVALARQLGVDEKEVRRMLDPRHTTKLSRIQAALSVLGKRLVVGVEEAA
jgi:antitoxin HicB